MIAYAFNWSVPIESLSAGSSTLAQARAALLRLRDAAIAEVLLADAAKTARWERVRRRLASKHPGGRYYANVIEATIARHEDRLRRTAACLRQHLDEECIKRAWQLSRARYIARVCTIDTRDLR